MSASEPHEAVTPAVPAGAAPEAEAPVTTESEAPIATQVLAPDETVRGPSPLKRSGLTIPQFDDNDSAIGEVSFLIRSTY